MKDIKKIIMNNKDSILRFLISGGSSTLLDFIIYMLISDYVGITYGKLISMTIACIYSFFINKNWTFKSSEKTNKTMVIKFIFGQVLNISINTAINTGMYYLTNNKIVSYVIATLIAMICNYLYQKIIVFKISKGE